MKREFSVLMSVYKKEDPNFLKLSLQSIWNNQSLRPKEIVLVKDGPLNEDLDKVILNFEKEAPLKIVALENNIGLGGALNEGLKMCSCELVARMDTDDIAFPNRFEKQIDFLVNNSDIHVLGSWVDEFEGDINNIISQRKVPQEHGEIMKFLKRRNPMNHPSVVFRKSSVNYVGGYQHFYLNEDYYLWARMISQGFKFYNQQESLLFFRTGKEVFRRRGGINYAIQDFMLQKEFKKLKLVSQYEFIINCLMRCTSRLLPNFIRGLLYKKLLRN